MTTDRELLRQYIEGNSEAAFAEVVSRHIDFVYVAAKRLTAGDAHLAEDVTQRVFIDLARKAGSLTGHPSLAGWLHTSTRYTAATILRGERRRQAREQEAYAMNDNPAATSETLWIQLEPLLDEAIGRLSAAEREALLLRYFHNKSHREVGELLGLKETVAQKRISRALEKMRAYFNREGVTATPALVLTALTSHSQKTAPVGFAASVTGASLAGAAGATGGGTGGILAKYFFTSMKIKTALIALTVISATALLLSQHKEVMRLLGPTSKESASTAPGLPTPPPTKIAETPAPIQLATPTPTPAQVAAPKLPPATPKPALTETTASTQAAPAIATGDNSSGPSPQLVQSMIAIVNLSTKDAAQAAKMLASLPDDRDRSVLISAIAENWLQQNSLAATQWMATLPATRDMRDRAIDVLARTGVPADPQISSTAFQLALTISTDAARINRLNDILNVWAQTDPAGATQAVQAAAITDEERTILMGTIGHPRGPHTLPPGMSMPPSMTEETLQGLQGHPPPEQ